MKLSFFAVFASLVAIAAVYVIFKIDINFKHVTREAYETAEVAEVYEDRFQSSIIPIFWNPPTGFEVALKSIDTRNLLGASVPITEAIGADILFIFVDDYAGLKQFPYYDYFSFDEIEAQTSADNTLSVVYDLQMESDLGLKKFRINVLFFKGRIGDAKILEKTVCVARYLYSEAIFDKNVYDIPRAEEFKQD